MLCGFREVSGFVKTTRIHLKHSIYLQCTIEIGNFALYPVRLKSISDPFKNIRNETIYQCDNCSFYPIDDINHAFGFGVSCLRVMYSQSYPPEDMDDKAATSVSVTP